MKIKFPVSREGAYRRESYNIPQRSEHSSRYFRLDVPDGCTRARSFPLAPCQVELSPRTHIPLQQSTPPRESRGTYFSRKILGVEKQPHLKIPILFSRRPHPGRGLSLHTMNQRVSFPFQEGERTGRWAERLEGYTCSGRGGIGATGTA